SPRPTPTPCSAPTRPAPTSSATSWVTAPRPTPAPPPGWSRSSRSAAAPRPPRRPTTRSTPQPPAAWTSRTATGPSSSPSRPGGRRHPGAGDRPVGLVTHPVPLAAGDPPMPVTLSYPGIYIEELPSSAHTITAAPTSITVFTGYTHPYKTRSPGQPVRLFSF